MKGRRMSRKDKAVLKIIVSLGVLGLVIGFCAPRVNAQVPAGAFTNAHYSGRYACIATTGLNSSSGGEGASAVMKLKPNGAGGYDSTSILSANDSAFGGSGTSFCSYTLDTTQSAYTVSSDGTGFESLVWTASSANEAVCPASFTDLRAIALRNLLNINGVVIDVEFSSANLLGLVSAGNGYCLK
jgi:hypothetical protein